MDNLNYCRICNLSSQCDVSTLTASASDATVEVFWEKRAPTWVTTLPSCPYIIATTECQHHSNPPQQNARNLPLRPRILSPASLYTTRFSRPAAQ